MNNHTQNPLSSRPRKPRETNPTEENPQEIYPKQSLNPNQPSDYQEIPKTSDKKVQKTNIKKLWWLFPVLGLLLVLGGVTVIRLRDNDQPVTVTKTAPLSVGVATATREPLRAWISSEGTVRAVDYQHLTFDIEGDVTYLANQNGRRLREGDRVTKGQLLARIDDRELTADVTQAQAAIAEAQQNRAAATADVAQARAQVAQARSQVQEAQAQLQNAQAARRLAATSLERYRTLVEEGAIAEIEFDERQNTLEDAQAGVQSAQAGVQSAQQQVQAAQAQVQAAQQQVEAQTSAITTAKARLSQAEVALEGASIYAPFNGIIAYLNISEGEYFSPQIVTSQLGGDYQGILERIPMVIIDPSQYEVMVDLAGPTGEQVEVGQNAVIASETQVNTAATSQQTLITNARARGEVFAVNPAISPGGRAIEATIRLNPSTTETLRHGEQVLTWIAVSENPNAVTVPIDAIVRRDRIPYVFVVNEAENIVEQREVGLGITGITQQGIIRGVTPGELVVTEGQNRLVDGAAVDVINQGR
ncbi:efflux RND transporter periplasmic adaptor subunit [Cyanothece sp. BG0011]|uniref:efflux RND transporter periplasmic adaptor subunit n=1 Tax=Cyanothece sp. BG0011 TaxID=2082950 RepID=UPI000D1F792F|nr:biotin/lipoyl-binding protein [Cyanothece sp. BG0011]